MMFHRSFLVAVVACLVGFWLPLALIVWKTL